MSSPSFRILESASSIYNQIEFKSPDDLFNQPAPEPWVSFLLGGFFSFVGIIYFLVRLRRQQVSLSQQSSKLSWSLRARAVISALIDVDDEGFVVTKMAAQSFLVLGVLQIYYQWTVAAILMFFTLESTLDSLRILLALAEVSSLSDLVVTGTGLKSQLRKVYEDISRSRSILFMVFTTQAVLISFVVTDIFDSQTNTCPDGTKGCPVVGTFGSWCLYVLGMFMASVFLIGPKTAYGQSEQNPAFWLQLLLSAKAEGTTCTWYDPIKDENITHTLRTNDVALWIRFTLSFLANGVGFHILVHALPIQVAIQSSLTGVVIRAVGMMYLVDLDDTPGIKFTIVEGKKYEAPATASDQVQLIEPQAPQTSMHATSAGVKLNGAPDVKLNGAPDFQLNDAPDARLNFAPDVKLNDPPPFSEVKMTDVELSDEIQRILDEAHAKLDALGVGNMARAGATGLALGSAMALSGAAGSTLMLQVEREMPVNDVSMEDGGA
jgi:hypothetical protein